MKILTAGLVVLAAMWQAAPGRQATFRSGVETVAVYATVQDAKGRPVLGLGESAFELFDNGQRREISAFSNAPQPTAVAFLLDRSGSMNKQMDAVKDATGAFVDTLTDADRASLSTLMWDCEPLTSDRARLHAALDRGLPTDLGSPIWRSLERVLRALDVEAGRRAVLILSDGEDSGMMPLPVDNRIKFGNTQPCRAADAFADVTTDMVIAHARQEGTLIYAVVVPTQPIVGADLPMIAKESGGASFTLKPGANLTPTFAGIAAELRHQYLIGFVPAVFDGRLHTIDVRIKKPGLTVRARKSYIAAHAESSGPEADARAFATRSPLGEPAPAEIDAAIRDGAAGRTAQAMCSAAAEFTHLDETRASVRVVAEGPIGRIMRAAGAAHAAHQPFGAAQVTAAMRAAVVAVTAALEGGGSAAPLTGLRLQSRGQTPVVLTPLKPGADVLSASFDLTDFKGLPGPGVDVVVSSGAGVRRCRLNKDDVK